MKKFEIQLLESPKCNTDMKWANVVENGNDRLAQQRVAINLQYVKKKKPIIFAKQSEAQYACS